MKNILVIGSTGHIGKNLIKYLQDRQLNVTYTSRRAAQDKAVYLDLCRVGEFDFSLLQNVEFIIFAAANLNAEDCESHENEVRKVNVDGTIQFISAALKQAKKVIYLSSDIIYGFDEYKVFDETSTPAPTSNYGKMKLEVENYFAGCAGFKSLRPSYVFSMEDKFVQYCKKCMKTGDTVEIYHPYYRKFIPLFELCECIYQLIERWQECDFHLLNVCGNEMISKVRIADEINRIYKKNLRYQVVTPDAEYYKIRPAFLNITSLYLYPYGLLQKKDFGQAMEEEKKLRSTIIW
ncbi:NAD-dependent epimerase/dehydratase family protein [Lachnospiraceae bacterium]|nr:NAD-dependent epimerase/dehydratase family protein [Lachnospiraceae bacterium]